MPYGHVLWMRLPTAHLSKVGMEQLYSSQSRSSKKQSSKEQSSKELSNKGAHCLLPMSATRNSLGFLRDYFSISAMQLHMRFILASCAQCRCIPSTFLMEHINDRFQKVMVIVVW